MCRQPSYAAQIENIRCVIIIVAGMFVCMFVCLIIMRVRVGVRWKGIRGGGGGGGPAARHFTGCRVCIFPGYCELGSQN